MQHQHALCPKLNCLELLVSNTTTLSLLISDHMLSTQLLSSFSSHDFTKWQLIKTLDTDVYFTNLLVNAGTICLDDCKASVDDGTTRLCSMVTVVCQCYTSYNSMYTQYLLVLLTLELQ